MERFAPWIAWGTCVLSAAIFALGAYLQLTAHRSSGEFTQGLVSLVPFLAVSLVGAFVAARKPGNAIGWMLCALGLSLALLYTGTDYAHRAMVESPGSLPFGEVVGLSTGLTWIPLPTLMVIFLPLMFPTGRLISRRWRPFAWAGIAFVLLRLVDGTFDPANAGSGLPGHKSPIAFASPIWDPLLALGLLLLLAGCVGALASLFVRYRRAGGDERHQIKWFLFAACLLPLPFIFHDINLPLSNALFPIVVPAVPVAIAIAIMKYRLYDIDVVINRTLVYGALAVFITAVYVAIVVGIGALIGSGGKPNLGLSIVATAIVAVAFQPVRERVQKVANRLVYGKRATPYEVLSQFSERVAESYAAEDVLPRMARVLAEGTGAERATVWLRSGTQLHAAATWPQATSVNGAGPSADDGIVPVPGQDLPAIAGAARAVPVRHQGELLGALSVTKRPGESLTPIEDQLLDDLAHQAGLVLKNVGLTSELRARVEDLRASRQRLVAAQDEERRRLERNLHDGAQQNLVAIKVKLGLAEMFAEKDPTRAKATLAELRADTDEALETLRDLARGIYPPLLADKGLAAALESQARKATVPIAVDADGIGRYAQDVEAAVYFCVLEALQNVQKYAGRSVATVRLRATADALTFEVGDDGAGFDAATQPKGSGLQNMADRLDALGGRVTVTSALGEGTRVAGTIPVAVALAAEAS
jgi:signal transduction histidine kinase